MPAITKPSSHFNAVTYTGTGSERSITGVGFQPDFVWAKAKSNVQNHTLFNSVVGTTKYLFSNATTAETTNGETLKSFNADGYTLGTAFTNETAYTYVSLNWKAGGTAVTNTSGTISSQVSANPTAGFSVVTWAGNSTNAATIGHGLGVAPSILITKSRTNASSWVVGIGGISGFGVNDYLSLNSTNAKGSSSTFYQAYGSSTFTVGVSAADEMNKTGNNYVTYCFAQVAGYSAFGSYTGNGSTDGPFVYTGFRPKFVLVKSVNNAENWAMSDTSRSPFNAANLFLRPDETSAETTGAMIMDFNSNGFKMRNTDTKSNGSGYTYIYMAFAEAPFKYSNGR